MSWVAHEMLPYVFKKHLRKIPFAALMLGSLMPDLFTKFFVYQGTPGIFWAVQLGALVSFVVLAYLFRSYKQPVGGIQEEQVLSWTPTVVTIVMIAFLALSPIFDKESKFLGGIICAVFGIGSLFWYHRIEERNWKKTKLFCL